VVAVGTSSLLLSALYAETFLTSNVHVVGQRNLRSGRGATNITPCIVDVRIIIYGNQEASLRLEEYW